MISTRQNHVTTVDLTAFLALLIWVDFPLPGSRKSRGALCAEAVILATPQAFHGLPLLAVVFHKETIITK